MLWDFFKASLSQKEKYLYHKQMLSSYHWGCNLVYGNRDLDDPKAHTTPSCRGFLHIQGPMQGSADWGCMGMSSAQPLFVMTELGGKRIFDAAIASWRIHHLTTLLPFSLKQKVVKFRKLHWCLSATHLFLRLNPCSIGLLASLRDQRMVPPLPRPSAVVLALPRSGRQEQRSHQRRACTTVI